MSNLEDHEAEQDAITARHEAAARQPSVRTNFDRATEGLQLCDLMESMTGVDDLASQITDAMCHLMHVCRLMRDEDGEDICFESALETARMNFDAECDEDPDQ